jgi:siroheme synthase-like protein
MSDLPEPFLVALQLRDRPCLILGGTPEAEGKARQLLAARARVTLVAQTVTPGLDALHTQGALVWEARTFALEDTRGMVLVLSTLRDPDLAASLQAEARLRGFLVCTLDVPAHSDFHNVAVVHAGRVTVGLSSGGALPELLKRLREDLSSALDSRFQRWVEGLVALREATAPERRRAALTAALRGFRLEVRFRLPPGA